jgi:hypothetical protein
MRRMFLTLEVMGNIEYKFCDEVDGSDVNDIVDLSRNLIQSFFGDPQSEDFNGRSEDDEEVRSAIDRRIQKISEMIKSSDAIVAMDGKKIVAVSGFERCGNMPDGREILQRCNVSVLPKYRGRKINGEMYGKSMKRIEEKYPNAVLMGFSRNDVIIDVSKSRGYSVISYGEYQRLTGQNFSPKVARELKADGYVALMKDPLSSEGRFSQISGKARLGVRKIGKFLNRGR